MLKAILQRALSKFGEMNAVFLEETGINTAETSDKKVTMANRSVPSARVTSHATMMNAVINFVDARKQMISLFW